MKNLTFVLLLVAAAILSLPACSERSGTQQEEEMMVTEKNQKRLRQAVPEPELTTSLERTQLVRRLERFNEDSKISYIYLLSFGRVMSYHTIKGKVSSVNSKLTTTDQVIRRRATSGNTVVVESPDLDGSYGSNGDAIFFFTSDDVYVEWNGQYMLSDRALRLTQEPLLIATED